MGAPKPFPTRWPEPGDDRPEGDSPTEPYGPDDTPEREPDDWPELKYHPRAVTWAITNPCNLRCIHCYDATPDKRRILTTEQATEVIYWLREAGVGFIVFSGGEPLLRRDLLELMACCQRAGVGFGMRTNATLIRDDLPKKLKEL